MGRSDLGGDSAEIPLKGFIESFATDIYILGEARKTLLSHPSERVSPSDANGAFCRMIIIRTVDAIEDGLLRIWQDEEFLRGYHAIRDPMQRIESLVRRFHERGIEVNPQVISEFLGLRYLRNMMVHARLKKHERSHLMELGFPVDVNSLAVSFFARTVQIANELDDYIGRATFRDAIATGDRRPVWTTDLSIALTSIKDPMDWIRYLPRPTQLEHAWRHNLEAISWWLKDQAEPQTEAVEYVADLALEAWRELVQVSGVPRESVEQAIRVLTDLHQRQAYSVVPLGKLIEMIGAHYDAGGSQELQQLPPERRRLVEPLLLALKKVQSLGFEVKGQLWEETVPDRVGVLLLCAAVPEYAPIGVEDLLEALRAGARAYKFIPPLAPIEVFRLLIPLVEPRRNELRGAGLEAVLFCKLARYWYAYVESAGPPSPSRWAEYERAFQ
jgi:hypothetical protein